jgi:hypothetical protein
VIPLLLAVFAAEPAGELPLHPDDLAVLRKIAEHQKLDAPPAKATKGWPLQKGEVGVRFASRENPSHALTVLYDSAGRVTKLAGNGPLLDNESLKRAAALPELRVIRIDHNIPAPKSGESPEPYDGSGFAALADSKLDEVKIGHAFDDDGLAAIAKIQTLRVLWVGHSRVTDKGVEALRGHPNIEEFKIRSQGRPNRITDKSVAVLATLPKLKRLGLHETFVTYDGGLKHLAPLKGRLESLSLKASLVLPADVEKLRADLPDLMIETSAPAEVLASPNSRGLAKWASPAAQNYLKTAETMTPGKPAEKK